MRTIPFNISYLPQIEAGKVKAITRDGLEIISIKPNQSNYGFKNMLFVTQSDGYLTICDEDGFARGDHRPDNDDILIVLDET